MYFLTKPTLGVMVSGLVIFLVTCGGLEEVVEVAEESCLGQQGRFVGTPQLSINNCVGTPLQLRERSLTIEPDSHLRECGWHDVKELEEELGVLPGCRSDISGSLHTKESTYRGFIILDVQCNVDKCRAVWELDFTTRYDVSDPAFSR